MTSIVQPPDMLLSSPLHVINGEPFAARDADGFVHVNPATGAITPLTAVAPADIDSAILAARQALPSWAGMPPTERRDILLRIAAVLRERATGLSELATWENGIATLYTPFLVAGTAAWFEYYAGYVDKSVGELIRTTPFTYTVNEPYGVIAAITPFNGPVFEFGMKVAPALAAGNTVVLKAPELAPFSAGAVAQIALDAGLPPGVLNVVVGDPHAADYLVRHPGIDKISFTGSNTTARKIMAAAAPNLTPLLFELGGKSACVVLGDGDISAAAATVSQLGMGINAGQVCASPSRVIAHASVYDEMVDALTESAKALKVGDPTEPDTIVGPVINNAAADRIIQTVDAAERAGAGRVTSGGKRVQLEGALAGGAFVAPTVVRDVDPASPIAQEEIFGPVISVIKVESDEEAIKVANITRYGLASYLFTRDISKGHTLAAKLESGQVAINGTGDILVYGPFGGKKDSGFGREGGRAGIDEFISVKTVAVDL